MSGKVETVLGSISPDKLGRTFTHEHLSMLYEYFYFPPPEKAAQYFEGKITLENVGLIKQFPYSNRYNLIVNDEESHLAVIDDVKFFHECGGGTLVENTSHGLTRNVTFLKEVSEKTGVNIVAGTGYYIAGIQKESVLHQSVESLAQVMSSELTDGCVDAQSIMCGFIGEVGSNWPLHEFERRAIQATGEVQDSLGCPVSFHPGRSPEAPSEIIRLYQEAGGKASKAVMSHLERTLLTKEQLSEFATLGTYCQFDLFGVECSLYQFHPSTDMPSDAQRINSIVGLVKQGKEDNILISHDIHTKHRLMKFGGHGYSHILLSVVPKLLQRGLSQDQVDKILIQNPRTWLTF